MCVSPAQPAAGQVEKYTLMSRERIELGKALVRAAEKAANPKPKAAKPTKGEAA